MRRGRIGVSDWVIAAGVAGEALRQAERRADAAERTQEEAPLAIQEAGREATRELRATLEALRDDDTTPPRGLGQVPELIERARAIGLDATLTVQGQRHDVPAAVDRTIDRIVQASLTNIARHAAATASVRIDYRPASPQTRPWPRCMSSS
jgi:signal transduction histidine kinase